MKKRRWGNRILVNNNWTPSPPAVFHQVFILKAVKVLCFDTLLEVLILKIVTAINFAYFPSVD